MGDEAIFKATPHQLLELIDNRSLETFLDTAAAEMQLDFAKRGRGLFFGDTNDRLRELLEHITDLYFVGNYRKEDKQLLLDDAPLKDDFQALRNMEITPKLMADNTRDTLIAFLRKIKIAPDAKVIGEIEAGVMADTFFANLRAMIKKHYPDTPELGLGQ